MADIFISYSSDDRERARAIADALGARGWSVWWDRKIPLGKSFDEVIEKALGEAECVIVLWSTLSTTSEWVRNEAAEAKRRGILIPVFLEHVNAPLAFRLLNGADLSDWDPGSAHPEFDKLTERITDLLDPTRPAESRTSPGPATFGTPRKAVPNRRFGLPVALGAVAIIIVGAVVLVWFLSRDSTQLAKNDSTQTKEASDPGKALSAGGTADMDKAVKDLTTMLGGGLPANALAPAFSVPDLGVKIAVLTPEQSAATLGMLPSGAVVIEVASDHPMGKAGIQVGDVLLSVAGRKINSADDLRQAIAKVGPGKTTYTYRRGGATQTVAVDCPACKVQ